MKNGLDKATLVPGMQSGPESGANVSVEDLFAIVGRKQILLEILQSRIEQLGEMNLTLQREIAILKGGSAIPDVGIDESAGRRE